MSQSSRRLDAALLFQGPTQPKPWKLVGEQDYLDGRDLISTVNDTLNTDLRQLVSDFHFPDTGSKLSALTKAKALNEGLKVTRG